MDIFEPLSSSSAPLLPLTMVPHNLYEEKWCIVCCSKVKVKQTSEMMTSCDPGSGPMKTCCDKGNSLLPVVVLERNLDVVFLLRNILKVPSYQLEQDLMEFEGNPEDWISLCGKCTELTRQGRRLYCELVKIDKELKIIQELIIDKTRRSSKKSPSSSLNVNNPVDKGCHQKTEEIWRRTRAFVKSYGYPIMTTNQSAELFMEGDKLANYLANNQRTSTDDFTTSATATTSIILIPKNLEDDNPTSASPILTQEIKMEVESILPDNYQDNLEDLVINQVPFRDVHDHHGPVIKRRMKRHTDKVKKRRPPSVYTSKRQYKHYEIIDGKYKCRHCNELFFSGSTCYVHEREKHPRIPGQYGCDICGRRFNSTAYLVTHRRGAHKVKQDGTPAVLKKRCQGNTDQIDEGVVVSSSSVFLDERLVVMEKGLEEEKKKIQDGGGEGAVNRFTCELCGEVLSSKWHLWRHEGLHKGKGERPFSCDLCGRRFKLRRYLKQHKDERVCDNVRK